MPITPLSPTDMVEIESLLPVDTNLVDAMQVLFQFKKDNNLAEAKDFLEKNKNQLKELIALKNKLPVGVTLPELLGKLQDKKEDKKEDEKLAAIDDEKIKKGLDLYTKNKELLDALLKDPNLKDKLAENKGSALKGLGSLIKLVAQNKVPLPSIKDLSAGAGILKNLLKLLSYINPAQLGDIDWKSIMSLDFSNNQSLLYKSLGHHSGSQSLSDFAKEGVIPQTLQNEFNELTLLNRVTTFHLTTPMPTDFVVAIEDEQGSIPRVVFAEKKYQQEYEKVEGDLNKRKYLFDLQLKSINNFFSRHSPTEMLHFTPEGKIDVHYPVRLSDQEKVLKRLRTIERMLRTNCKKNCHAIDALLNSLPLEYRQKELIKALPTEWWDVIKKVRDAPSVSEQNWMELFTEEDFRSSAKMKALYDNQLDIAGNLSILSNVYGVVGFEGLQGFHFKLSISTMAEWMSKEPRYFGFSGGHKKKEGQEEVKGQAPKVTMEGKKGAMIAPRAGQKGISKTEHDATEVSGTANSKIPIKEEYPEKKSVKGLVTKEQKKEKGQKEIIGQEEKEEVLATEYVGKEMKGKKMLKIDQWLRLYSVYNPDYLSNQWQPEWSYFVYRYNLKHPLEQKISIPARVINSESKKRGQESTISWEGFDFNKLDLCKELLEKNNSVRDIENRNKIPKSAAFLLLALIQSDLESVKQIDPAGACATELQRLEANLRSVLLPH